MGGRCYADTDRIKHFRADKHARDYGGLTGEHQYVEVRYDDPVTGQDEDGCQTVDEICTTQVHLEMMDEDTCWMSVNGLHVWLRAVRVKGQRQLRLMVTCHPSDCTPYVVKPGQGTLEGRERNVSCPPGPPRGGAW